MGNYTKKEKELFLKQQKEFKALENIKNLKSEIRNVIKDFTEKNIVLGLLTKEEQTEIKKFYSLIIAKINEQFYGLNVNKLESYLRDKGFKIPKNGFLELLDITHLHYYETILYKYLKAIKTNNLKTYQEFIKLANTISTNGKNYFITQYNKEPIESLIDILTKEKLEKDLKKKEYNDMIILIKSLKKENKLLRKRVKSMESEIK